MPPHRWFFDPVGTGLRPAKLHEKPPRTDKPDMNFWLTLPEIRCQAWLLGWAFGPRKLHEKSMLKGGACFSLPAGLRPAMPVIFRPWPHLAGRGFPDVRGGFSTLYPCCRFISRAYSRPPRCRIEVSC